MAAGQHRPSLRAAVAAVPLLLLFALSFCKNMVSGRDTIVVATKFAHLCDLFCLFVSIFVVM